MKNSGAEAVLISTATATHAPLILKGFELGLVSHLSHRSLLNSRDLISSKHVMCEKPIAVDVITTKEVLAESKSKPQLKFLVPFCRRCE